MMVWDTALNDQVQPIDLKLFGEPPPRNRSFSFLDENLYQRLKEDLAEQGIDSSFYEHDGPYGHYSYISWGEENTPQASTIIESYGFKWYSEAEKHQIVEGDPGT